VRTETDINTGALSTALAAVGIARDKIDLPESRILLLGAGQNAEIAARSLIKYGAKDITIANRDIRNAKSLTAKLKTGKTLTLEKITETISDLDLIISSTSSPGYIITSQQQSRLKDNVLIIDIAVPRDIDPKIGESQNITLYNLEDINRIVRGNYSKRSRHTEKAENIIKQYKGKFEKWYKSLDTAPVIKKLNKKTLDIARSEAKRYASNFSEENYDHLETFAESLAKKILHQPINFVKNQHSSGNEQLQNIELVNKMFELEDEDQR
jgi:glutamyl-tRNA reductase